MPRDYPRTRRIGEQMQLQSRANGNGTGQHGAGKPRLERFENAHDVDGKLAHAGEPLVMFLAFENALALEHSRLDLAIARQRTRAADAEAGGRLALGETVILYPMIANQPRGLFGDLLA